MLAIFLYEGEETLVLRVHAALYTVWFLLLFPLAKTCFTGLLPAFTLFQSKWVRAYTAILPTVMLLGFALMETRDMLRAAKGEPEARQE